MAGGGGRDDGPGGRIDVISIGFGAATPIMQAPSIACRTSVPAAGRQLSSPVPAALHGFRSPRSLLADTRRPTLACGSSGSTAAEPSPTSSRGDPTARWSRTSCCPTTPSAIATPPCMAFASCSVLAPGAPIPVENIAAIKMGTTVATNALLERAGERTVLVITQGFADALRIGYQNRPKLFVRRIELPVDALRARDRGRRAHRRTRRRRAAARHRRGRARVALPRFADGIKAVAIVLMHGYRYPQHERAIAGIARTLGFPQVSVSTKSSPLMKLVSRGDTTVVDAYLSPILRRYVDEVERDLGGAGGENLPLPRAGEGRGEGGRLRLQFMQSSGGLTDAHRFQGKDAILSGPAGGVVGAVEVARLAGFDRDHRLRHGRHVDRRHALGRRIRARVRDRGRGRSPARADDEHPHRRRRRRLDLHASTARGCASARNRPAPIRGLRRYRRGGPLTVTDCNVMVGKLDPELFPQVFGAGRRPAARCAGRRARSSPHLAREIASRTGHARTPEQIADGFLDIAVANMANAIKHISVRARPRRDRIRAVLFRRRRRPARVPRRRRARHDARASPSARRRAVGVRDGARRRARAAAAGGRSAACRRRARRLRRRRSLRSSRQARGEVVAQGVAADRVALRAHAAAQVRRHRHDDRRCPPVGDRGAIVAEFERRYRQHYGFLMPGKPLVIEAIAVEAVGSDARRRWTSDALFAPRSGDRCVPIRTQPDLQRRRTARRRGLRTRGPASRRPRRRARR